MDPQKAYELAGIVTLTFENGRWRDHGGGNAEDCVGVYSVKAGRISLHQTAMSAESPQERFVTSARWTLEDGKLRFFDVQTGHPLGVGKQTLDEDRLKQSAEMSAGFPSSVLVLRTDNNPLVRDGYINVGTRGNARAP